MTSRHRIRPLRIEVRRGLSAAAVICLGISGRAVEASVDFVESYDNLGALSSFTLQIDANNDFVFETTVSGPLTGRVDVELRLSDTGQMAQLEALRVKRLTLFAEPVLQLATSGYNAVAHNISYHMGDGLGQPATYALLGLKLASDAYTWSQSGPNVIAFRGTVRGSGPTYLGELLDVSKEPPYPVGFAGEWEWLGFGAQTRFRLAYQSTQNLQTPVPIRTRLAVVVEEIRPFAAPTPPVDFAAWAAANGLSGAGAGVTADPDNDGRLNLDEFAFDLDPTTSESAAPPIAVEILNGEPVYVFIRNTSRSGLEFHLEASSDFISWKAISAALPGADARGSGGGVVIEEKSLGGGRYRVVVRDPSFALDDLQRFARLRLVRQ